MLIEVIMKLTFRWSRLRCLVCPVSGLPFENTVTYSAGNGGQKICGVFSEIAPLQRSSTAPLKAIRMVGVKRACAL